MAIFDKLPEADKCCGCITDLKTAAAIIAVIGIVTSPALSWAVVRHAYVIRVSCYVTSSASRPDVVDINLNNILSFGFGANAGLGPSCLAKNNTKPELRELDEEEDDSILPDVVRYIGWIVFLVDLVFLIASVNFLVKMFKGSDKSASKIFMITALVSIILSFFYGMLFVGSCIYIGGSFPIFEFFFSLFDLITQLLSSFSMYYTSCGGAYKTVMDIASYIVVAVNFTAFTASIVFIFGIIRGSVNDSFVNNMNRMVIKRWGLIFTPDQYRILQLLGIVRSIPETAIVFMCAVSLSILVNLVFIVLAIVFSILDSECSRYMSIIAPAIALLLWLYFIIVVNSYEEEMLD